MLIILTIISTAYASDLHLIQEQANSFKLNSFLALNNAALCSYAQDSNLSMPEPDEVGLRYTFNRHGSNFSISDPIQSMFINDTALYNTMGQKANVLEIGAGFGLCAQKVFGLYHALHANSDNENSNTLSYVGADISFEHLAVATNEIAKVNKDWLHYWKPIVSKFPFILDDQYTHIGAFHVFHFLKPEEVIPGLKAIENTLKPGGKVYILTANPQTMAYGPLVQSIYTYKKNKGKSFPGYLEDTKKIHDASVAAGLMPEGAVENKGKSIPDHFLFMDTQELADLITCHTKLKVLWNSTINTTVHTKTPKTYTGIIAEK
jgi:SAM-dependent methyltransferase